MDIYLDYHPTQFEVFLNKTRFKVLMAGRRWGKTRGGILWLAGGSCDGSNCVDWWVSPTYRQAKIAYRYFRRLFFKSGLVVNENKSELSFEILNENRLEFRSAEIPDNLRGEGLRRIVVDECASLPQEIWTDILRPALMDTVGEAVLIGTPKGHNWFSDLYTLGQTKGSDYKSWRFTTYDNPFIKREEIEKAERELPELVARQEIRAEIIDTGGSVFRNVSECVKSSEENPKLRESYSVGIDLAKYQDFTVICVRNKNRLVKMERFNRIDWALQKQRIITTSKAYNNAKVLIDSTGVGDPIYEDLNRAGINIEPYLFTGVSKRELIDNLIILFDKKEIEILNDPVLISELKSYQYELTSGGRLKTNAPQGQHDDCVIALALAFWGDNVVPQQSYVVALPSGRYKVVKGL